MIIEVGATDVENDGTNRMVHGVVAPGNNMRLVQHCLSVKLLCKVQKSCRFYEALTHQTVNYLNFVRNRGTVLLG